MNCSLAIVLLLTTSSLFAQSPKPNIVVILCDDLGYGDLASYGHPHIKTPNLTRMGAEGIRFTDFYSTAPVCSSSRVGLMTGRSPNRAGVYDWIPPAGRPRQDLRHLVHMRRTEITIPMLMKQSGYATCMAGKWHCNSLFNSDQQPQPDDAGFDHWFGTQNNASPSHANPNNYVRNGVAVGPLKGYSCQLVVDEGINWLKKQQKRKAGQPFFMYLAFHEPHEPVASPAELVALYEEVTDTRKQAEYFANVHNIDLAVGRFLEALKRLGVDENTLVVFTADNGPETLNRYSRASRSWGRATPLRGMKLWTTDAGFRVAGIMRWPAKIKAGQVSSQPVSALDLLPTFCQLADVLLPTGLELDGMNCIPAMNSQPLDRTRPLVWVYYNAINERRVAMRDGDWKVLARVNLPKLVNVHSGNVDAVMVAKLTDIQIFHVTDDIDESEDLADKEPHQLEVLTKKLRTHYAELLQASHVWSH